MINKALELLNRDRLLYADMINLLAHREQCEDVGLIIADRRGVVLTLEGGRICMTALFEREHAGELLALIDKPALITSHQSWSEPLIESMFGPISDNTRCVQMVYTGTKKLPAADCGMEIRPMTAEFIPLAAEHYHMDDEAYLTGRMNRGKLFGGFVDDVMVGFIGFHSETAIGMLEVLPQYRRRGYGRALECSMINYQLERGFIPFGQVILGNEPSMALQRSLGFEQAGDTVSWMTTRFSVEYRAHTDD